MKISYMFRYSWSGLWNQKDRIFSFLNIFSVTMTMLILVSLTGLLQGFKDYSESVLTKLPLRIDIFKVDPRLTDLKSVAKNIRSIEGFKEIYMRVPTFTSFINVDNNLLSGQMGLIGCTFLPDEPLELIDLSGKRITLLSKKRLPAKSDVQRFDEIGIIVSFDFLKKLGYFPANALLDKPESWKLSDIPKQVKIGMKQTTSDSITEIPVPVIGVTRELDRGDYMITEDFYNILSHWQPPFLYMLKDRHGESLVKPPLEIFGAMYILNDAEYSWLAKNKRRLEVYGKAYSLEVGLEMYQNENSQEFEKRLTIISSDTMYADVLDKFDKRLREHLELANLSKRIDDAQEFLVPNWDDFDPVINDLQYMQATVYVKDRKYIKPVLQTLHSNKIYAGSPLERYLDTFDRQEKFFIGATIVIFALVLFLAGVVLFSTFYSSILRKKKEIGIFKAYGSSRFLILLLFYIQSTIIIVLGCIIGIWCGIELGKVLSGWLDYFIRTTGNPINFRLPYEFIQYLTLTMLITCWIAIFIPARIATNVDPADVVRS